MNSDTEPPIRRVVSCNGRSWETNAQGAADYLFNPVFMTFFFLCVVLYATLMQPNEEAALPFMAQFILWSGLIMSALVWLFLSAWLSVAAHDRGLTKAIYTPLLLLPLVFINAFLGEFVLSVFNAAFQDDFGTKIQNIVKNIVILVAFDIMHARFVVPQHPRYVPPRSADGPVMHSAELAVSPSIVETPTAVPIVSEPSLSAAQDAENDEATQDQDDASAVDVSMGGGQQCIFVSREKIDTSEILWIKSEDHYLSFQLTDRNLMLRGKLRSVVEKLGGQPGVQINRSVWVAYSAIRNVQEQKNGNLEVYLKDETAYRVASSRRLIFKQNYERFKAAMD